jgi:hypothetical protein
VIGAGLTTRGRRRRAAADALLAAAVVFTLAAGPGCMTPSQRRADALTRSAHEFNNGLRWGRDQDVFPFLSPADARSLQARRADLGDDLVVADEEMTSLDLAPGAEKATVVVEFTWYDQRRAVVKKSVVEQKWEWIDGRWIVTSQRRAHGERFPLVNEPAPKS